MLFSIYIWQPLWGVERAEARRKAAEPTVERRANSRRLFDRCPGIDQGETETLDFMLLLRYYVLYE